MFETMELSGDKGAVYRQLADFVADRVARGALGPGDRLPPQREIARMVGVNLTTVTRAFTMLQERGLVESRPGRGTVIAAPRHRAFRSAPALDEDSFDLSVNRPATDAYLRAAEALLPKLPGDPRFPAVQEFHAPEGPVWTREALAGWLAPATGHSDPSRIVVTNGAQHGLACALGAIAGPGSTVLAEAVTYQGIGALCAALDIDLRPVAADAGGMLPDAFAEACRAHAPRAVFLVPNMQNPTTVTLGAERRAAIAETARSHGVTILEDDVYRPLMQAPLPSFAELHPDITIHISSLSKCAAPGIRLGAISAPNPVLRDIAAILQSNCWSTGFLTGLLVARLVEEKRLDAIVAEQAAELGARRKIALDRLGGFDLRTAEGAPHVWLNLPEPWRGSQFARAAQAAGVGVLSGEAFAIDRDQPPPHAVRINLSAARSRDDLTTALTALTVLLEDGHRKVDIHA